MAEGKVNTVFEAKANPGLQIGLIVLRDGVKTKESVKFVGGVFSTGDPVLAQALLDDDRCKRFRMYVVRPRAGKTVVAGAQAAREAAAKEAAEKKAAVEKLAAEEEADEKARLEALRQVDSAKEK